jgi:hypothetical protein
LVHASNVVVEIRTCERIGPSMGVLKKRPDGSLVSASHQIKNKKCGNRGRDFAPLVVIQSLQKPDE